MDYVVDGKVLPIKLKQVGGASTGYCTNVSLGDQFIGQIFGDCTCRQGWSAVTHAPGVPQPFRLVQGFKARWRAIEWLFTVRNGPEEEETP